MGESASFASALAKGNEEVIKALREKAGVTCGAVLYPLLDKMREHGNGEDIVGIAQSLVDSALLEVTNGAFQPAIELFTNALRVALIGSVYTNKEDALRIIRTCRIYLTALRLNIQRKEAEPPRSLEMAALFAHFQLLPAHRLIARRVAMTAFYRARKFNGAAHFAAIVCDSVPANSIEGRNARIILTEANANLETSDQITYSFHPDVVVCGVTYAVIPDGHPHVTCPVCNQKAVSECKDMVCSTCFVAHYSETGATERSSPPSALGGE